MSRESLLLANNVLLVVAAGSVLLGTLYPLLLDALGLGKISVGPPYFDAVFVPLMAPAVFLMGVGPIARWKEARRCPISRRGCTGRSASAVAAALAAAVRRWAAGRRSSRSGCCSRSGSSPSSVDRVAERIARPARQASGARLAASRAAYYGMLLAHLGVAVFIIGVTLVKGYETEQRRAHGAGRHGRRSAATRSASTASREVAGPELHARRAATVDVARDGQVAARRCTRRSASTLVQQMPMTEAAIDPGFTRDLYVSLGEPVGRRRLGACASTTSRSSTGSGAAAS